MMESKIVKTSVRKTSIRIPQDVYDKLKEEAEKDSRTTHSLLVKILRDHVNQNK